MQSFSADDLNYSHTPSPIRPALTSFADEVCATVARLFAYVGVLALFGILAVRAWDRLQVDLTAEPASEAAWSVTDRSPPAFALSRPDASDKSEKSDSYIVFRHPLGGRRDVMRWPAPDQKTVAELEIYRPGAEYGPAEMARSELVARMLGPGAEVEAAGVIESKFGSIALLRQAGARDGPGSCLGFFKRIDHPALQLSGWSCRGDALPARRAAIDCMLNRLMLLTSGNEPKLAELFAQAELKRGNCTPATAPADWITEAGNPQLRGPL
jgi:hypothetical protein